MTGKQLTEYFRHIIDLECSIRCQREVMEKIKLIRPKYPPMPVIHISNHDNAISSLCAERSKLKYPDEPVMKKVEMKEPEEPVLSFLAPCTYAAVTLVEFLLVISAFCSLIAVGFAGFIIPLVIAVALHIVGHCLAHKSEIDSYNQRREYYYSECARIEKENKEKKKAYAQAIADFEAQRDSFDEKIKEARNQSLESKKKHDQAIEKQHQKWREQKEEMALALELAKEEVRRMEGPIAEAKKNLQALYDKGIIYPKYRNMVAICTIYEYLDSGRCSSLEGPHGAYNLFESELRQNLIISKLDEVIDNMNIIQRNQYHLYQKLDSIDSTVKNIHKSVDQIASNTKAIASNTKAIATNVEKIRANTANIAYNSQLTALSSMITAQCAAITAQNTEAMKYIALIK